MIEPKPEKRVNVGGLSNPGLIPNCAFKVAAIVAIGGYFTTTG
ncbi:MAG: hypothetical protein WCS37_22510 [Chloroflexota bacterium]